MNKIQCYKCSSLQLFNDNLSRSSTCEICCSDLKVCLNCSFFDRNLSNQCHESQAELVQDKEKSNFCDWFKPKIFQQEDKTQKKEELLNLKNFFKESEKNEENDNKLNLNNLFKK